MLFSTSTFDSSKLDNPSYALCWLSRNYHRSCLEHHTFTPCIINNSTNRICFPLPNYLGNNLFIRRREVNVAGNRGVEPRTELTKNRMRPKQQGSRLRTLTKNKLCGSQSAFTFVMELQRLTVTFSLFNLLY